MNKLELLVHGILGLSVDELRQLNSMLEEGGGEAVGVREPRRPLPESPGDEIANDIPEDYWETAP